MTNKQSTITALASLLSSSILLSSPLSVMAEGTVGVGTGFDFSTGEYGGTTSTDTIYIPVNFKYQNDLVTLKLTTPYVRMTSESSNVVGGGSDVIVKGSSEETTGASETNSGLGDCVFSAGTALYEGDENNAWLPTVDLTGKIKFPTADEEKGLGTGETDYSVESDLTWFSGSTAYFGTLGYKFMGSPEAYELNNVGYGSVGLAYQLSPDLSPGLIYDVKQASTDSGTDSGEATGYVSYKLSDDWKFLFYGVKGFTDGSADYGVGCTVSYSMDAEKVDWMAPVRRVSNL
ncbi:MAG: transporter [Desulfobulbaceae bacterium]|nr:transporter [Desulfobulbaceae bacterium]